MPTSPILIEDACQIADGLRTAYESAAQDETGRSRANIEWAILYWLMRSMTTESFTIFARPLELHRFLAACGSSIHRSRWRFDLPFRESTAPEFARKCWGLWKNADVGRLEPKGEVELNFARLRLKHPNDRDIIARMQTRIDDSYPNEAPYSIEQYATHNLHSLFHMMAILLFKPDQLVASLAELRSAYVRRQGSFSGGH